MKRLFIDGYIMCPASRTGGVPELGDQGSSKTLTQFAMEQLVDKAEILFGDTRNVLRPNISKADCTECLAQIRSIAQDQLDRPRVGILDEEV